MPWFRVDDNLAFHAKAVAAGNAAMGLWVRAGSWSAQQLTEGHVPAQIAATLGKATEARRLVDVGLWVEVEDGYDFHEWGDRQPSKAQVEADRHAARERQRRAREAAKSRGESRQESRRDIDGSHGPPGPALPVVPNGTTSGGGVPPKRRSPERPIPDDWQPTQTHRDYAAEHRLDLDKEIFKFRNHATANDRRQRNWNAAFSTWLARAEEFAPKADESTPSYWREAQR